LLIADKLKCHASSKRDIMLGVERRQHKDLNDIWAEGTAVAMAA
jgi:hypothetical protein